MTPIWRFVKRLCERLSFIANVIAFLKGYTMRIVDESRFSLSAAARRVGVHAATIWRWTHSGVGGHKLESVRIGGRRYVLEKDISAFLDRLNCGSSVAADKEVC